MKNLIHQTVVQCQFQLLDNQPKTQVRRIVCQGQCDRNNCFLQIDPECLFHSSRESSLLLLVRHLFPSSMKRRSFNHQLLILLHHHHHFRLDPVNP